MVSPIMLGCFGYSCGFFKWVALADLLNLDLAIRLLSGLSPSSPQPQPAHSLSSSVLPSSITKPVRILSMGRLHKVLCRKVQKLWLPPASPRLSPLAYSTLKNSHRLPCLSSPSASEDGNLCPIFKCNHLRESSQLKSHRCPLHVIGRLPKK